MQVGDTASGWATPIAELIARIRAHLPDLILAAALLVLGWALGRTLQFVATRLLRALTARLGRIQRLAGPLEQMGFTRAAPTVLGAIVFWSVFLFFLAASVEQVGLPVATILLRDAAAYVPNVLVAVLVVFAGVLAGNLARHGVSRAADAAGVPYAGALGLAVQTGIVVVAVVVGLQQVGVAASLLVTTIVVILASSLGGAALAFGLGARPVVTNMIASYYVHRSYRPGQRVRIGAIEGQIAEITPTAVMVETREGRVLVPPKTFSEECSVLLSGVE